MVTKVISKNLLFVHELFFVKKKKNLCFSQICIDKKLQTTWSKAIRKIRIYTDFIFLCHFVWLYKAWRTSRCSSKRIYIKANPTHQYYRMVLNVYSMYQLNSVLEVKLRVYICWFHFKQHYTKSFLDWFPNFKKFSGWTFLLTRSIQSQRTDKYQLKSIPYIYEKKKEILSTFTCIWFIRFI